jgi:hypothetical protein
MKKWLRSKLHNFLYPSDEAPSLVANGPAVRNSVDIDGLSFNVMSANGGAIVQLRQYDNKLDRNKYATYIITEDEPMAERIGQIVSMELLRL